MLNIKLRASGSTKSYANAIQVSVAFQSAISLFNAIDQEAQKHLAYLIFDDFSILIRRLFPVLSEDVADALAVKVAMELFSMKAVLNNPSTVRLFLSQILILQVTAYLVDASKKREIAEIIQILPILKLFHHENKDFRE